jgi:uncharacterized phage-associated protein
MIGCSIGREERMCNVRKLAQMAAYFLHRAGGPMEHAKLMKLMYLADREAIDLYGLPISEDDYWATKTGPALALTLNLMGGYEDYGSQMEWGEWVSAKENFQVGLRKEGMTGKGLNWLAGEEIAVLKKIYDKFGDWPTQNLIDYAHGLQEWIDPRGGRLLITFRSILEALGKSEPTIEATLKKLDRLAFIRSSPISIPPPKEYERVETEANELEAVHGA